MDFKDLVTAARTCRRFDESTPLSMEDLTWLVDCARLTPSAKNAQVLLYILVGHGATCDAVFSHTRWAAALPDWGGPQPGERPTGFIAILTPNTSGELTFYDVGIAAQTIHLAASSRGWGCCILKAFAQQQVSRLLDVPQDKQIALLLGLGIAKEERLVDSLPTDGSTTYWRDAQGRHHVPKRDLAHIILRSFNR